MNQWIQERDDGKRYEPRESRQPLVDFVIRFCDAATFAARLIRTLHRRFASWRK